MAIVTLVDIAGYFFVLATFSLITQVPFFVGATRREALIEHGPDSDHVFFPVEILRTNHDKGVFDFFATAVFRTINPGRARIPSDALLIPTADCADTLNEYSLPFARPCTTQLVAVVVHTVTPSELVTTYVTGDELTTASHDNSTDRLRTDKVTISGGRGATSRTFFVGTSGATGATGVTGAAGASTAVGVTVALAAPLPFTCDATTETT